jgi:hypothetical protein
VDDRWLADYLARATGCRAGRETVRRAHPPARLVGKPLDKAVAEFTR